MPSGAKSVGQEKILYISANDFYFFNFIFARWSAQLRISLPLE
jgi:hypothetical protein